MLNPPPTDAAPRVVALLAACGVVVLAAGISSGALASPQVREVARTLQGVPDLPLGTLDDLAVIGEVADVSSCAAWHEPHVTRRAHTSALSWTEAGLVEPRWPDLRVSYPPSSTLGVSRLAHPAAARATDAQIDAIATVPYEPHCTDKTPLPAREWFSIVKTPGPAFTPRERKNAEIIFETFIDAGHGPAIALAAIVNAWSESALQEDARMDQPFYWEGVDYPDGTGAIGLFQLLPSIGGAGGPSGPERGYPRLFLDGRWAGTPRQARLYGDTPDAAGRRYYDGTDPKLNTLRILLEIERDGARLLAAERAGASIAQLAYIFGRDIERPQNNTYHRKELAVRMFGEELALARHPNRLFEKPRRDWRVHGDQCHLVDGIARVGPAGDDGLAQTD